MHIRPLKSLGQNFLTDKNIQRKIITACNFNKKDSVVEIGSGRGEFSELIAPEVGNLKAIELDARLIPSLKEKLANFSNCKVLNENILKLNFAGLLKDEKQIKVFGNLPYYITTPIIELILQNRNKISEAFFTVQKEFALRMAASNGSKEFGSFSCFVQFYSEIEILFFIKKNSFFPVPKVDSAFIKLSLRKAPLFEDIDENKFFSIIRAAFNKRRKTLRNSLEGVVDLAKLELFFKERNLSKDIRPEQLSLQDFSFLSSL